MNILIVNLLENKTMKNIKRYQEFKEVIENVRRIMNNFLLKIDY